MIDKDRTVLIYNMYDLGLKFYVVDGDWSRFEGVYINEFSNDKDRQNLQSEFCDLMYDRESGEDHFTALDKFPVEAVREGASVVITGFLP